MTSTIRLRALRAAQVASLSVGLASTSAACDGASDMPDAFAAPDAPIGSDAFAAGDASAPPVDAAMVAEDTGAVAEDTGTLVTDAGADAGVVADAGADAGAVAQDAGAPDAGCTSFPPTTQACCLLEGGFWDEASMFCAIAVPGPFVPPTMNA